MKKTFTLLCIAALISLCTACINETGTAKYPHDFVGVYDTKTEQLIKIGEKKTKTEKILGDPVEGSSYICYNDNITINYDSDDLIRYLHVQNNPYKSDNVLRFELPGGFDFSYNINDFINSYEYVYEYEDSIGDAVCIFVIEKNEKYKTLSKDALIEKMEPLDEMTSEEKEKFNSENNIYQISVTYEPGEEIKFLTVRRLTHLGDQYQYTNAKD